ncbi:MAG: type I restriction modification DNA specificity domain protein [Idiomarina sp. T82-3]|uniref:restriction endonuclease subunit S n=1 Tax=Idiomarina TaxID=135575 RepID=UPI0007950B17|nr:restriction endonuclease subunit S [Idiomarina sp. T82-3]KXS34470.1 MAG: type I restriction modification DNA specificity domain protein [Idiomarina sp. T82-3]
MVLKPSDLEELPEGWKNVDLGSIMQVRQGLQIPISERLKKPTPTAVEYITIQSIKNKNQEREYVESPSRRVVCEVDDVLMTRTGNTGIVITGVEGAFHNNFFLMDFERSLVNRLFLVNYLRSPRVQHLILVKAGSSTIPDLNHRDFYSIRFPLPPLEEQKKIAQILSTWDKAITTTEQLLANSQQQKKALMQQLLTGKKRLLDENGVRFSGEWSRYRLKDIGNTFSGLAGKSKADFGKGTPYIPYKNIFKNSRVDLNELDYVEVNEGENQSAVKFGDIFFTTSSEIIEEVGMSSVLIDDVETLYLNSFCFGFRLNDFETLTPQFAQHLFRSESSRRKISKLGQGATRYNLSKKQLTTRFEFKVPPINEQIKIASVLSNADNVTAQLSKQLVRLKYEKKALMQQLLTGKRRVKLDKEAT